MIIHFNCCTETMVRLYNQIIRTNNNRHSLQHLSTSTQDEKKKIKLGNNIRGRKLGKRRVQEWAPEHLQQE